MKRNILIFLGMMLALNGCTLIPKYERPELSVPAAWPEKAASPTTAPLAPDIGWREFFKDTRLQGVIESALANNRDLRVAALNVEKVSALYRIQRSELYPGVGVLAVGEKYRLPGKMAEDGRAETIEQYSVNLGFASWELDLFGRIRSLKQRALNQFFATEQAHCAARISLIGAVANTYLVLAADLENLHLARATFDAQKASYELIARSRELGVASDLDLRQAQSQVEAARVDMARYAGLIEVDLNALNLLAGTPLPPDLMLEGLGSVAEPGDVGPGLSSEVLLRRPDILMAEHQLKAANANIGAARAAFFPRISLTLGGGSLSPDLSGLFGSGTGTWTFAPQIIAPLFAGGLQLANLKVTKVERAIAVAFYEKAIQTAFREVSDSLALRTSLAAQQEAAQALVGALEETHRLSNARYEAGVDGYLGVLVAQRSLYAAQQGLVAVRLTRLVNQVTLYKVLGGGR